MGGSLPIHIVLAYIGSLDSEPSETDMICDDDYFQKYWFGDVRLMTVAHYICIGFMTLRKLIPILSNKSYAYFKYWTIIVQIWTYLLSILYI